MSVVNKLIINTIKHIDDKKPINEDDNLDHTNALHISKKILQEKIKEYDDYTAYFKKLKKKELCIILAVYELGKRKEQFEIRTFIEIYLEVEIKKILGKVISKEDLRYYLEVGSNKLIQ